MLSEYNSSLLRYLQRIAPLNQAEAELIFTCFESVWLKENDYFLKAGMPVNRIGYLSNGVLRVFNIDAKGNEAIRHFISEERFFADLDGLYQRKPSGTFVQAVTTCHLLTIPVAKVEMLKQSTPKLEPIINRIGELTLCEQIKNTDFLRTGTSAEQYRYFITHFPQVAQRIPLKDVASFLRITQQSLSRIRRKIP
jgi:CRP-like cAMP-binding protein